LFGSKSGAPHLPTAELAAASLHADATLPVRPAALGELTHMLQAYLRLRLGG
jgi:hypothetical protein